MCQDVHFPESWADLDRWLLGSWQVCGEGFRSSVEAGQEPCPIPVSGVGRLQS